MKQLTLLGLLGTFLFLNSCGGKECYRCRKDSYYNGVHYTDPGPWTIRCKQEGETSADFEERINQERSRNYTCEPK